MGLPAVSLLDFYMDVILSAGRKQVITLLTSAKGLKEWRFWIGDIRNDSFSSVEMASGRWMQEKVGWDGEQIAGKQGAQGGGS